jgi:hypothetical protein
MKFDVVFFYQGRVTYTVEASSEFLAEGMARALWKTDQKGLPNSHGEVDYHTIEDTNIYPSLGDIGPVDDSHDEDDE